MRKSVGIMCAAAAVASGTALAAPSHAEGTGLQVLTGAAVYAQTVPGRAVVEDFTDTSYFSLLSCQLDSESREQGLQAGDIEPGAVYSTHCTDPENFEMNIDGGSFEGGFLDGFHHGERFDRRALRVSFTEPVHGFGFDTNVHMGDVFKVRVVRTDGSVEVVDGLELSAGPLEEQFYGFVSDAADIKRVRIAGRGDSTFGFALDDFRFNPAS